MDNSSGENESKTNDKNNNSDNNLICMLFAIEKMHGNFLDFKRKQVDRLFWFAVILSSLGSLSFLLITIKALFFNVQLSAMVVPAIGATVTDILAGIVLLAYKKVFKQYMYYESLNGTERLFSATDLVGKIDQQRRDDTYIEIIRSCLKNNKKR